MTFVVILEHGPAVVPDTTHSDEALNRADESVPSGAIVLVQFVGVPSV